MKTTIKVSVILGTALFFIVIHSYHNAMGFTGGTGAGLPGDCQR
jgi:hypothetical protein